MSIPKTLRQQVGGSHYMKYLIQPLEFAEHIGLSPTIFCAFKYVCRYKDKNGLEDLQKAKHCIQIFRDCGLEKSIEIDDNKLIDFLSQFDELQGKAIFALIQLQGNKRLTERRGS